MTGKDRMTLTMRPDALAALGRLVEANPGYSATDLVNKAVRLLDLVESSTREGATLTLVKNGEQSRVVLL